MDPMPDKTTAPLSRSKLLEAATRLYAEHGFEKVSLRQICRVVGAGNNNAVQYHFGSQNGLILAILEQGIPILEKERQLMLSEIEGSQACQDTRALVDVLFRPLVNLRDSQGDYSYAGFVLALHQSPRRSTVLKEVIHLMPTSVRIRGLVQAANKHVPPVLMVERFRMVTIMFLTSVFRKPEIFDDAEGHEVIVQNATEMCAAALSAPVKVSWK